MILHLVQQNGGNKTYGVFTNEADAKYVREIAMRVDLCPLLEIKRLEIDTPYFISQASVNEWLGRKR